MANFNNFQSETDKLLAAAERGMEKATTKFQADTMNVTPVVTGALKRSWTHGVNANGGTIEGAVGSNLVYAPYVDDKRGTLTDTLNSNIDSYLATVADEIKSAIGG